MHIILHPRGQILRKTEGYLFILYKSDLHFLGKMENSVFAGGLQTCKSKKT